MTCHCGPAIAHENFAVDSYVPAGTFVDCGGEICGGACGGDGEYDCGKTILGSATKAVRSKAAKSSEWNAAMSAHPLLRSSIPCVGCKSVKTLTEGSCGGSHVGLSEANVGVEP